MKLKFPPDIQAEVDKAVRRNAEAKKGKGV